MPPPVPETEVAYKHALFDDIVLKGLLRLMSMPQWDDVLTRKDIDAIHAYLISTDWDAYNAGHGK